MQRRCSPEWLPIWSNSPPAQPAGGVRDGHRKMRVFRVLDSGAALMLALLATLLRFVSRSF